MVTAWGIDMKDGFPRASLPALPVAIYQVMGQFLRASALGVPGETCLRLRRVPAGKPLSALHTRVLVQRSKCA